MASGCVKFEPNPHIPPQHIQGESTAFSNKPYDEAYEISQDLSMAESYDGREKASQTLALSPVSSAWNTPLTPSSPPHSYYSGNANCAMTSTTRL